jgi:hypothetical protein
MHYQRRNFLLAAIVLSILLPVFAESVTDATAPNDPNIGVLRVLVSRADVGDGGWLAVALYQLVDRNLLPPMERQRALAARISKALDIEIPTEADPFRGSMSDFI